MGASVPLPMKVNNPLHHKKSPTPSNSGSKPSSQIDGVSLGTPPEDCKRSQGKMPATIPGPRIVKKSDFRISIHPSSGTDLNSISAFLPQTALESPATRTGMVPAVTAALL